MAKNQDTIFGRAMSFQNRTAHNTLEGGKMIVINKNNATSTQEKIYIHDSILIDIEVDRRTKVLTIKMQSGWEEKTQVWEFDKCIYYEGTLMSLYDGSPNILMEYSVCHEDEKGLIKKLEDICKLYEDEEMLSELDDYITVRIYLLSGDEIKIVCKEMRFTEIYN